MTPIPLASPDGTVYAYACGVCNHVGGTGEAMVRVEPGHFAESSRVDAESCCTCFDCGVPLAAEDGRCLNCRACNAKRFAARPLPEPGECQSIECRIGRGWCSVCGSTNGDEMDSDEFSSALLALFDAAHELALPEPDRTAFCGAAKDLLLALGMEWDEKAQKYRLTADAQEADHG